jgi:hypothetical protein
MINSELGPHQRFIRLNGVTDNVPFRSVTQSCLAYNGHPREERRRKRPAGIAVAPPLNRRWPGRDSKQVPSAWTDPDPGRNSLRFRVDAPDAVTGTRAHWRCAYVGGVALSRICWTYVRRPPHPCSTFNG